MLYNIYRKTTHFILIFSCYNRIICIKLIHLQRQLCPQIEGQEQNNKHFNKQAVIVRDKTMADKFMYIPNEDTHNSSSCR